MADRKPWEEFSSTTSSDAPAEQKPWEAFGGEPKPEPKGFLGHARDSAIALGTGLAQGVQMLTNVAGADNAVSQGIGDAIDTMRGWESPERQSERAARAAKIKQAEESGSTWEEVKAYAGSFADAPLDTTLEALGTAAPTIAGAALTGGGSTAAQLAARAAPMALGAAQGVGAVKGEIHESVENRWKEAGASDEEAAARAAEAQSYAGENAGNIALGGALGVLAGSTGVESAVRRMAGSSLAREAAERAAPGVVRGALTGALYEAPMEALQGGQERYAANVAGQREGFDVPTWQGVAGQATLEGMASAPLGGGFGAANAYAAGRQRQDGADGQDAAGARGGDGPPSASPFDQAVPPPVLDADALERAGISQTPGAILDEQQLQRWGVDSLPPAADLPQIKPSEQMGLDPATGPMSAAAAMAVDSGASAQAPQAAQAVDPETGEVLQQQDAPGSEPATGIVGQLEAAQGPEQVRDILRRAEADDVVHALAGRPDLDQVAQSGLSEGAWNLLRDELSTARDLRARDRLAFVEQQARVNGGWDSLLANERNRLLNELGERRAASAGDASGAGQAAQAVDTAGSPAGEQRGGPGVAQSQATREAVDAVKQQTAEAIGQRLQGMKAGEVNTFAARILPTMGLKPTASKARNIALLTDGARVNLYGVAGELGVELSDASRSALEADMAGTVAEPIPATTDAASPVDVAPFRRALVDDSAGRTHDGYYMEVGPGYISLAEDATRVYPVMVDNGLERRSDSSGGAISRAYEQAVEIAQKLGKQFTSDSSVTVSAARVYESLKRKGYAVEKSQSARLATKPEVVSDRWMTDDGSPVFVVGPKGEGAQQQAGGSSNGVQSAAAAVPDNGAAQGGADVQRVAGDVVGVVDGGPASGAAVAAGVPVAGGQQAPTTQTAETPAARWQSMTPDQRQDALAAAGYVTAKGAPNVVATANKGREWDALGEKVRSRLTESMSGQGRAAQAQAADAAPATATTPTPQYSSGDRVVADRDVIEGDIVTTPDGRQWMARVKRGRSIPVVPFENGKPVVSADTSRSFDLDETEVTHTGTNVYGHGNQPKPDVQKAQSGAAQSAQQGALPEFKTAVEFEQWLDEQVTEDREQLNSRSGDDGVGKVVLNEGKWIVSYDSGMTGRQRAERNPTYDARLVYRLDDGRLVWWEVETGRVLEVTQDDSRLEMKVGKEHAPEREDMSPSYMEVEHDGQIYSLMLPDSASRVTAEQLEEELYTRDFPAQVNEMFRQRVRESKPDAQQAGPATASQADADTESAQQPAQAEAQDQPAESAMDAAATQKARIADSVEKLADSDDTPQFSRASAAQQAGPNDAEIRALVEQYAAEDGAPSAAEITEAVRQFRETEAAYGGREGFERAKAAGKTKLNYQQWVQVRTPNFKRWFGDWEHDPASASKVTDPETGEPMVVYHGTNADFSAFDKEYQRAGQYGGRGFFFTTDPETAGLFGDAVMPVFLNARIGTLEKRRARAEGREVAVDHIRPQNDQRDIWVVFDSAQIKSATGNIGTFDSTNPDIRFSFAGRTAQTADQYALAAAQRRIATGENAETVRQDTGWHRGDDGKWRFEISDDQARVAVGGANAAEIYDAALLDGEVVRVADVLDHPQLFAAYPHLADVRVELLPAVIRAQARYQHSAHTGAGRLQINPRIKREAMAKTLLHELQHGIQFREGFAVGGSPEAFASDSQEQGADTYRRLAGEVEARNVETRRQMTPEQRRAIAPGYTSDTMPGDVLVTFNGKRIVTPPHNATSRMPMTESGLMRAMRRQFPGLAGNVEAMLARGRQGKKGGLVMLDSADPLQIARVFAEKTGRTLDEAVEMFSKEDGSINGFYDPKSGLTFMVGPNLDPVTAPAVLLHESGHGQQREEIDAQAMDMLTNRMEEKDESTREFLDRVAQRMIEAGVATDSKEAAPYIVEQAVIEGRSAGYKMADSKFFAWADRTFGKKIGDFLRSVAAGLRTWMIQHGGIKALTIDDLVGYAMAGVGRAAEGNVRAASNAGEMASMGERGRAASEQGAADSDADSIQFSRSGRSAAELARSIGDGLKSMTVQNVKKAGRHKLTDWLKLGLQFMGRRQLVDVYGDVLPMADYDRLAAQMEADKNDVGAAADDLARRWGKLPDEGKLADLMHDATLAGIDADSEVAYVPGDDRAKSSMLKAQFKALTPEAQKVYREARDHYKRHHSEVRQALADRIMRSELSSERRAELLKRMDDDFFKSVKGVYFPLARFGQYVVVTRDAAGQVVSVSRAETMSEAEAMRQEMVKGFPASDGYRVGRVTLSKEFVAGRDMVGRGFMSELFKALDEQHLAPGVMAELEDTLGQLYLSSLPDLSWAKHGIHRKGTPGFSQDARRAFAQNTFHGARYLAKLRYGDQMQAELDRMQKHVDEMSPVEGFDQPAAQRVVDEMNKRHEAMMNPKSNPLSTALTSFGFVYYLGISPAAAIVNLSQTPLVAYPVMGAKWGFRKAGAALMRASAETMEGKNDLRSRLKNPDEIRAYDEAVRTGVIDVTMAHDLAGIAQGEDAKVMWKMRPVMRAASFLFHHAERFNRQATFLAAYRLARDAGAKHDTAYSQAVKATYDGHFDYSSGNRPRVMQGNVARVVLLFKQYAQNMIFTLSRNAYQSVKGASPEVRREARRMFGALLTLHAAAAGVLGLPLVGTLLTVASALGGDDDEPWDAEVALRNLLADAFGPKASEVVARGFSRLTPWDISGRVGLDKLLLPDVQEGLEGQRWAEAFSTAMLGPVIGMGVNAAKAAQKMADGDYGRGLEDLLPIFARNPIKAYRYWDEGAQDRTGIEIKGDVGMAGVLGQAAGFSPSEVRLAFEGRSAVMDADRRLSERRSELMSQFARAAMDQDIDAMNAAREAIRGFNEKNPGRRITAPQMWQSVRNRQKRIRESEDGVYLPRTRRDLMDAGRFAGA